MQYRRIIINPIGGLANRMRAIASGVALCHDYNYKLSEIAWPLNSELYCPFEILFDKNALPVKISNINYLTELLFYDEPRKKNLFLSPLFQSGRYADKIIDTDNNLSDRINSLKTDERPILIRSGVEYYPFHHSLYRKILIPQPDLLEQARSRLRNGRFIGLHIRRTDNVISITKSPTQLFIDAVNFELSLQPYLKFYLATDDEPTKAMFIKLFGTEKIICSETQASRTSVDGIKEAMIELLCLSLCEKIYGSYWSSFSEAASMLGDTELTRLYLPT